MCLDLHIAEIRICVDSFLSTTKEYSFGFVCFGLL